MPKINDKTPLRRSGDRGPPELDPDALCIHEHKTLWSSELRRVFAAAIRASDLGPRRRSDDLSAPDELDGDRLIVRGSD